MSSVLAAVVRGPFVPLGRAVDRRKDSGAAELKPLSVYLEAGVVPRASRDDNYNRLGADLSDYLIVDPGDVVFNKLRTWQGGFGVSKHAGIVSPAYYVCRPRSDYEPRFLHYLLHSSPYLAELTRISKFMPPSQFDILWEDLRAVPISKIALAVQREIADFLDAETARIDALVAKKRRLQALLTERWKAQVDRVTHCGREVSIRSVTSLITSGPRGWAERVGETGAPFIRSANLQRTSLELRTENLVRVDVVSSSEARRSRVHDRDSVIGITGANTGWVGYVTANHSPGYVSQHVAILRPAEIEPGWLAYSLFAQRTQEQLLAGQYGGTKQQLGLDDLAELKVYLPSTSEQRVLCATLDRVGTKTAALSAAFDAQVLLLQERRQALITAAVTGELDINGAA